MAKKIQYGQQKKRLDLGEVLPLDTPLAIVIDPSNACNFRCKFCPTGNSELLKAPVAKSILKASIFEKVLSDMKEFKNEIRTIQLLKDGEPLLNKKFCQMVRDVKKLNICKTVETTTNGALLNAEVAEKLVDSGLDSIRLSIYGTNNEEYKKHVRSKADFNKIKKNVRHLYEYKKSKGNRLHIHSKLLVENLFPDQKKRFVNEFSSISDSIYIHAHYGSTHNDRDFKTDLDTSRMVCSEPFLKLIINADGTASACCNDFGFELIVGDAKKENLVDIWNGEKLFKIRMSHLAGKRNEIERCRRCEYVKTLPQSNNIDSLAKKLIERYEKHFRNSMKKKTTTSKRVK